MKDFKEKIRCNKCKGILFVVADRNLLDKRRGIEIKCKKCGHINKF